MKNFLIAFTALLLYGCCAQRVVQEQSAVDSVRIETKYVEIIRRDTIVVEIPYQSAFRETRDTTSHLETKYAISDAKIDASGILHHSLESKNVPISVPTEIKTIVRDSIIYRDRDVRVKEVKLVERELTEWQKWQMRSFWILLSIIVVCLIYHFRRSVFNFIVRVLGL